MKPKIESNTVSLAVIGVDIGKEVFNRRITYDGPSGHREEYGASCVDANSQFASLSSHALM